MSFFKKLGFFSAFVLPAIVVAGSYAGGWWNFSSLFFVFVFIPVIDFWLGLDTRNVPNDEKKKVAEEFYYRFITYAWTYLQFGFLLWCVFRISTGALTPIEWIGFTIGCALVTGGIGITVAHELGHKKSPLEQFYSKALLMTVCYMHFFIEHNRGHHVYVATPEDPATARKGQNFYSFWIQSVFGSIAHAWKLEKESLARRGTAAISPGNQVIWFTLIPLVFCGLLLALSYQIAGTVHWEIAVFFFTQSVMAFSLLELVNYIEHYGILRKKNALGEYERVNPQHSWNASHLVSNFFLFQLQRHSDHHYNAIKRYQVLDHFDESPQLPFGYPTMILAALLPPVWFGMIDKRLEAWEKVQSAA
jgi:alkane 1-monooxygenase